MIDVIRFPGISPSVGYTDFRKVYISECVTDRDQYATLHKHECGHVWLQHLGRMLQMRQSERDQFDSRRWNQAADLEIALHLYDQSDDGAITQPRSWLATGIRKSDATGYPDCEFAEEFYEALVDKPLSRDSHDGESNDGESNEGDGEGEGAIELSGEDLREIVAAAKGAAKEIAKSLQSAWREMDINAESKAFRPRPSLASEIDKRIGRPALARVASYRRPNRRESEFFKKGVISVARTPRLSVYVDRSGSFDATKTESATVALSKVLQKYRGRVEKDAWFFNDCVLVKDPLTGGGGTNYKAVVQHIVDMCPEVAIIITDDDPCDQSVAKILLDSKCKTSIIVCAVGVQRTNIAKVIGVPDFVN